MFNKEIFTGKVKQIKGDLMKEWGKITDDDLKSIKGDYTKLTGIIQEKYGLAKAEAEKVSKKFEEAQKDWDKTKTEIQKKWDKIKEEDLEKVKGDLDKLADVVKDKYEVTRSEAEKMIEEIQKKIKK